jgi:hypothetical protein
MKRMNWLKDKKKRGNALFPYQHWKKVGGLAFLVLLLTNLAVN